MDWNENTSPSPSESAALAETAISANPFAVISKYSMPSELPFHARLAEEKIHSIVTEAPNFHSSDVNDGLFWTTQPTLDIRGSAAADFACQALVGREASHAGDSTLAATVRKFAIVNRGQSGKWANIDPIVTQLQNCGATVRKFRTSNEDPASQQDVAIQLDANGFTTVIQVGLISDAALAAAATRIDYFPEWLAIGLGLENNEGHYKVTFWAEQADQAFGITPWARARPPSETPACWATEEGGRSCDNHQIFIEQVYGAMLLLAAGVQGSGPQLTEESFRRTLWETKWPNPNPGRPPFWQQQVSLSPGDPAFYDDYAIWWWNEDAPSQQQGTLNSGPGSFCYINRGARFTTGSFPANTDSRLFSRTEPCR